MSFICAICRDLLKISEETSSRQLQNSSPNANNNAFNSATCRRKGKSNSIVATKCGHLFHYPCLSVWLSQSMNLTPDSIMRCPSCKQLIYIYELLQLFPVEGNIGTTELETMVFQQKMKCVVGQLEDLIKDLGKKNADSNFMKGNETPTRMQRIRDSPKKSHQFNELMKGIDSLRVSIKELNSAVDQHLEWGSVIEKQSKEISELKSKNEELLEANEKMKAGSTEDASTVLSGSHKSIENGEENQSNGVHKNVQASIAQDKSTQNAAQDLIQHPMSSSIRNTDGFDTSAGVYNQQRRKSVTFVDHIDEIHDIEPCSTANVSFETRVVLIDLRIGDKVVWKFEGYPEIGTVKWKGFVGSQINVGVEFERQLGLPIKDHSSDALQCIFKSKPGHGRLIPVAELSLYDKALFNYALTNHSKSPDRVHCELKQSSGNSGAVKRHQMCTHQ